MIYKKNKETTSIHYGKHEILNVYYGKKLVWEYITGYIFTSDGYSLSTSDGYVIKCSDQ